MSKPTLFFLVLLLFFVSGCIPTGISMPETPDSTLAAGESLESGWYSVYFTDPDSPTAGSYRGGPDSALAQAIKEARLSVDAAFYHLNLWSIRDALIEAHEKGVAVRIVLESDNLDEVEVQELKTAGIEILGDRRESLMHNKFVVIDKSVVWTGSMNFTINGAYRNDNSLVRIRSSQMAENYTTEFEEMFVQDMFGDNVVENTPHPNLSLDGTRIETYFSPDDGTEAQIVKLIQSAEENIKFMAYSFTSDSIAQAMLDKARAGIRVSGVFEEGQYYANIGTEYDRLLDAGLDVWLDGNSRNMHHKIIILDDEIVILGSFNFSRNAEEHNDENTLVVHDPDIAALYLAEFERVYAKAAKNP